VPPLPPPSPCCNHFPRPLTPTALYGASPLSLVASFFFGPIGRQAIPFCPVPFLFFSPLGLLSSAAPFLYSPFFPSLRWWCCILVSKALSFCFFFFLSFDTSPRECFLLLGLPYGANPKRLKFFVLAPSSLASFGKRSFFGLFPSRLGLLFGRFTRQCSFRWCFSDNPCSVIISFPQTRVDCSRGNHPFKFPTVFFVCVSSWVGVTFLLTLRFLSKPFPPSLVVFILSPGKKDFLCFFFFIWSGNLWEALLRRYCPSPPQIPAPPLQGTLVAIAGFWSFGTVFGIPPLYTVTL